MAYVVHVISKVKITVQQLQYYIITNPYLSSEIEKALLTLVYTVHCTLDTVHYTVHGVQCTPCIRRIITQSNSIRRRFSIDPEAHPTDDDQQTTRHVEVDQKITRMSF